MGVKSQPILAVRDVRASARWYAQLLGSDDPTGSPPSDHDHLYRRIYVGGQLVLQLHAWDEEDHPNLIHPDPEAAPPRAVASGPGRLRRRAGKPGRERRMRRSVALCLSGLMAGTVHAAPGAATGEPAAERRD
jgi:hypothetical protein